MKMNGFTLSMGLTLTIFFFGATLVAQTNLAELGNPVAAESSSSSAPAISSATIATAAASASSAVANSEISARPFSSIGVDAKIGIGGIGFDVATPLARKFNLRGGGYFFRYNTSISENHINYGGHLNLGSGQLALDWFPHAGGFHLSGGVVFYNGNQITGTATLNPNQSFTLNGTTYYASITDPVHASASLALGNKAGPTFSVGWGNIVPRKSNKHISIPFEIGFIYVGDPAINLGFTGSTCNAHGTACQTIASNPTIQSDIAAQRNKYQNDLSALRFYPTISIGFGYKF